MGGKRDRADRADPTDHKEYSKWLDHRDPAVVANALICLIHQANYLLDQQLRALEREFVESGGYSERLAAARLEKRRERLAARGAVRTDPTDRTDRTAKTAPAAPSCQSCGKPMTLRTARKGAHAGSQFWGCSGYPACKATLPV